MNTYTSWKRVNEKIVSQLLICKICTVSEEGEFSCYIFEPVKNRIEYFCTQNIISAKYWMPAVEVEAQVALFPSLDFTERAGWQTLDARVQEVSSI